MNSIYTFIITNILRISIKINISKITKKEHYRKLSIICRLLIIQTVKRTKICIHSWETFPAIILIDTAKEFLYIYKNSLYIRIYIYIYTDTHTWHRSWHTSSSILIPVVSILISKQSSMSQSAGMPRNQERAASERARARSSNDFA